MWYIILAGMAAAALGGAVYLTFRFHKFSFIQKIAQKSRVLSWVTAALPVLLCAVFFIWNVYTVAVVLVHLVLISLLVDLVTFIVTKCTKKQIKYDVKGFVALGLTAVYLTVGFFCAYHIFRTDYALTTNKNVGKLRVALIADSHVGVTLDGERFAEQMKRIEEDKPDVLIVAGDFVDDDTSYEDMIDACRALGEIETTCGVYFVFGNHDAGYFRSRKYSLEDLRVELTGNGVTVLEDESVLVDDRFYIVGRKDRSMKDRKSAEELTAGLDRSKYILMIDHQPNDYVNEAASRADLVLSGHTHGGHIFPAGIIGRLIGANDFTYGHTIVGDTDFIVTSGISGWALPIKTGTASEYVIVEITTEE